MCFLFFYVSYLSQFVFVKTCLENGVLQISTRRSLWPFVCEWERFRSGWFRLSVDVLFILLRATSIVHSASETYHGELSSFSIVYEVPPCWIWNTNRMWLKRIKCLLATLKKCSNFECSAIICQTGILWPSQVYIQQTLNPPIHSDPFLRRTSKGAISGREQN
jgi:hypothetical protein